MDIEQQREQIFSSLATVGQALGNQYRLRLISLLCHGENSVERLAAQIGQSLAATSAHLKVLRASSLVAAEKRGKHVFYRLANAQVAQLWLSLRETAELVSPEVRETTRQLQRMPFTSPLSPVELAQQMQQDTDLYLIDLRPEAEFTTGHLPRAKHLPYAELSDRMTELPTDRDFWIYCRGPYCKLAASGVQQLREADYLAHRLRFSVPEWHAAGLPVESPSAA